MQAVFIAALRSASDPVSADSIFQALGRHPTANHQTPDGELLLWTRDGSPPTAPDGLLADVDGSGGAPAVPIPLDLLEQGTPETFGSAARQFHSYLRLDEEGRPVVWTDHCGMSPIHHVSVGGWHVFCDDPFLLSRLAPDPDPAMVASFLTNGFMLMGRTPFDGVRALPTASVVRLTADGPAATPYWRYRPGAEPDTDTATLEDDFWDLVRRSTLDHAGDGPVLLSLSGGVDSAVLLGLLRDANVPVAAFSFVHGAPGPYSDAGIGARRAQAHHVEHRIYRLDDMTVPDLIRRNLASGLRLKSVCFEAEAFASAAEDSRATVPGAGFMFGDHVFGQRTLRLRDRADMLGGAAVKTTDLLDHYDALLSGEAIRSLQADLEQVYSGFLGSAPQLPDRDDIKDWLYLPVSATHHLLPMRRSAAGTHLPITIPWFDIRVLDIQRRQHSRHRLDKRMFRRLIRRRMPDVFDIPTSRDRQMDFDFLAMLRRDEADIRRMIDVEQPIIPGFADAAALHRMLDDALTFRPPQPLPLPARVKAFGEQAFRRLSRRHLVPIHWFQPIKKRMWNTHRTLPGRPVLFLRALHLGLVYRGTREDKVVP